MGLNEGQQYNKSYRAVGGFMGSLGVFLGVVVIFFNRSPGLPVWAWLPANNSAFLMTTFRVALRQQWVTWVSGMVTFCRDSRSVMAFLVHFQRPTDLGFRIFRQLKLMFVCPQPSFTFLFCRAQACRPAYGRPMLATTKALRAYLENVVIYRHKNIPSIINTSK